MDRPLIKKILVLAAIFVVILVGIRMMKGKPVASATASSDA